MSDTENIPEQSEEIVSTKKTKKILSDKQLQTSKANLKKAIEARKKKSQQKDDLKNAEELLTQIVNKKKPVESDISDEEEPKSIKQVKQIKKDNRDLEEMKQLMALMNEKIKVLDNVEKKIEKLYTLKKNKQPKSADKVVVVDNTKNNSEVLEKLSANDKLLSALKQKMIFNQ